MSGTLYLVATPIGNLEDITLRALRILREVSLIAAEDTRRTSHLLHHHAIVTRMLSFHEHNFRRQMPELMRRLRAGHDVAVVSDAGTPLISDPGLELVQACLETGVPVEPIPGASAPIIALVASGFRPQPVTIMGFAPASANARETWGREISQTPHTVVFFEAPHRIRALLEHLSGILGTRPLCVTRELTKMHQEIVWGTAQELATRLNQPRGEFTIVVGPRDEGREGLPELPDAASLAREFRQMTDSGRFNRRAAISALAKRYGRSSRVVYAALEDAKSDLP